MIHDDLIDWGTLLSILMSQPDDLVNLRGSQQFSGIGTFVARHADDNTFRFAVRLGLKRTEMR
jgi:hypothetical protein